MEARFDLRHTDKLLSTIRAVCKLLDLQRPQERQFGDKLP